jgi:hypothetical protein
MISRFGTARRCVSSAGRDREGSNMQVWVAALGVLIVASVALGIRGPISDESALGVFFWFQVTDFDDLLGLFSLCHFIFPSYLFWVVLVGFSDTERQLTPAFNVLFWNQVVEANQLICCALAPFNS